MDCRSFDVKTSCDFVFAVCDVVAEEYGPLYQCVNEIVAIKRFIEMLKVMMFEEFKRFGFVDKDNYVRYKLFCLGVVDRLEGVIMPEKREIVVDCDIDVVVEKFNKRGVVNETSKTV